VRELGSMSESTYWPVRAACRHPELLFPEGIAGPALRIADQAKQICGRCPVQARCLNWALDHEAAFGIWGGFTEVERRDLRRTLGRVARQPGSQLRTWRGSQHV
jgi:WhiB family transcriptional regulator, redox-sensing transcriptional regulator